MLDGQSSCICKRKFTVSLTESDVVVSGESEFDCVGCVGCEYAENIGTLDIATDTLCVNVEDTIDGEVWYKFMSNDLGQSFAVYLDGTGLTMQVYSDCDTLVGSCNEDGCCVGFDGSAVSVPYVAGYIKVSGTGTFSVMACYGECDSPEGTCSACAGSVPFMWELTVSGVTNDECTDCSIFNDVFILSSVDLGGGIYEDCHWVSDIVFGDESCDVCDPAISGGYWDLTYNILGTWQLTLFCTDAASPIVVYTLSDGGFDCSVSKDIPQSSTVLPRCNFPGTLTIVPG